MERLLSERGDGETLLDKSQMIYKRTLVKVIHTYSGVSQPLPIAGSLAGMS